MSSSSSGGTPEAKLKEAYYSPKTMGSLTKMLQLFKGTIPAETIKAWVKKQEVGQLFSRKRAVYMPILAKPGQAQMDLMFFPFRGALKPILVFIDVATRKLYADALKSKSDKDVAPILKQFVEEAETTSIVSDAGLEFVGKAVKGMLAKQGVELVTVEPGTKEPTGIVESVNRTLRGLLSRYTETIDSNWPKALPDLVENYNSSKHSALKAAPNDVTKEQMEKLANHQYIKGIPYLRLLDSFHEGDKVRVALKRKLFKKGTQTFGKEIHEVEGHKGYQLQLDDGTLHVPRDLLKVGAVETHAPAGFGVSEESRLKKKKTLKRLKELADYTTAPKRASSVTRSKAAAPPDTLKKSKRLPAAVRKLADYNTAPK
jgi:hypothetical protein